ncbi:MAG: Ig-like domain-containing protein [Gemmatimonadaceae bacterium]|nr:Ig-like domain-containing protein [Gemmatimonadaceae bacterium]
MVRHRSLVRYASLVLALALSACSGSESPGVASPAPTPSEQLVVRIDPMVDSLLLGTTRGITATVTTTAGVPRSAPITYTSLDPAIASFSGSALTAIATGQARIVASIGTSADTTTLRVFPPSVVLRIVPNAVAATLGDTLQFEAMIMSANGGTTQVTGTTWSVSDSSAATVVRDGTITATGEGELLVVAKIGEATATAAVLVAAANIASVSVEPSNLSLSVGGSGKLTAELRDSRGRLLKNRDVAWSSSKTSVATIAIDGTVTALAPGGAIITARAANNKVATAAVNVTGAAATSVSIVLPNDSLGTGRKMQATATPLDANGNAISGRPVAWQSSNPSVATINSSGLITALTSGQTTLSVICDGKVASQRLTIAVPTPTDVVVMPPVLTLFAGASSNVAASVVDQFGVVLPGLPIAWASTAPGIATVSSTGLVSAVALGTVSVRATSGSLVESVSVSVQNVPVASVTVAPSSATIAQGEMLLLSLTARDSSGQVLGNRPATWSSSSSAIATVTSAGVVEGVAPGTAVVSAVVEGKTSRATIVVTPPAPPAVGQVVVSLNSTVLAPGQSTNAVARAYDEDGTLMSDVSFTFSSTDPGTATVSGDGRVRGVGAGSTIIKATTSGVEGFASVTVQPIILPVRTVLLSAPTTALMVGDSTHLVVETRDSTGSVLTGRTVSFTTSNAQVIGVTVSGTVRAVGAGSATIVASSEGKSATLAFTVSTTAPPPAVPAPVASVAVALNSPSLSIGQGTQATATLRDSTGAVLTGRSLAWRSSNAAVATVNQSGYVTSVGAGSAMISAQSGGKSGSAAVTVLNAPVVVKTVTVSLSPSSVTVGATSQATAVARDSSGAAISGRTVSWAVSSGASVATLSGGNGASTTATGAQAGSATVTATIDGVAGSASLTVTAPPPPPPAPPTTIALPASPTLISFSYPTVTGKRWVVNAGDNLQVALNSAARGDEIVIQAGATFTGNFTLPAKTGSAQNGWILIRSDKSAQLPPQGTRVTPTSASLMPKLVSPNASPALKTLPNTSGWWISGVEFSVANITAINYGLVALGDGAPQNSLATVPSDLVLDRTFVHGLATSKVSRCISLNSARTAIQDSYIFDCHLKGFDSQAILGWNGPGPFRIVNNTLAGAGENIMFGGADPSIPNLIPSDIEIRRNYIYTPVSWKGTWTKKNLFELKNAQRVLVAENVLEGSWLDGQTGEAFVLKVSNQNGACTWCATRDVTIRNNIVRNAGAGFAIMGQQGGKTTTVGELLNRLLIEHNIVENINTGAYSGAGRLISLMQDVQNLTIRQNTMTAPGALAQYLNLSSVPAATNFDFQNNIMSYGSYGFFSSWYQQGENNVQGFRGTVTVKNTVMIGTQKTGYPNGQFVSSLAAAQATGFGANTAAVNAATQGVVIP